jgi:hypothetical protein
VLNTTLSHVPELETELELLGSRCITDLIEGQLDALWTQMHWASESIALCIPPPVAHDSPYDRVEE